MAVAIGFQLTPEPRTPCIEFVSRLKRSWEEFIDGIPWYILPSYLEEPKLQCCCSCQCGKCQGRMVSIAKHTIRNDSGRAVWLQFKNLDDKEDETQVLYLLHRDGIMQLDELTENNYRPIGYWPTREHPSTKDTLALLREHSRVNSLLYIVTILLERTN